jgi:hypothetical protein
MRLTPSFLGEPVRFDRLHGFNAGAATDPSRRVHFQRGEKSRVAIACSEMIS